MNRKTAKILIAAFAVCFCAYSGGQKFYFIGSEKCRKCHNQASIGDQYSIWLVSPHARAYRTLGGDEARRIAAKFSIEKPGESLRCLKCHTTGRGKTEITANEGVGCEACHGPASAYIDTAIHVDFKNRENGYARAKKYGMYPVLSYENHLKFREKLCLDCHNRDRECFPETVEGIKKQTITIIEIDTLIKGDVKLRHNLRKF